MGKRLDELEQRVAALEAGASSALRYAPEPGIKPSWADAPEWANWLVQREDGAWNFWREQPSANLYNAVEKRPEPEWEPSWDDAPEWAQWLAQDADGQWFWYDTKPFLAVSGSKFDNYAHINERAGGGQPNPSWHNTLEKRPVQEKPWPQPGDKVWWIDAACGLHSEGWYEGWRIDMPFYRTELEAQAVANWVNKWHKIVAKAAVLDAEHEHDGYPCTIVASKHDYDYVLHTQPYAGAIVVHSEAAAEALCDWLNDGSAE